MGFPSPSGEGIEGWRMSANSKTSTFDSPHPNPSPEGEGLMVR